MSPFEHWQDISTAPTDGRSVWVYAEEREGLPAFAVIAAYHPNGGWCVDELRHATRWHPLEVDAWRTTSILGRNLSAEDEAAAIQLGDSLMQAFRARGLPPHVGATSLARVLGTMLVLSKDAAADRKAVAELIDEATRRGVAVLSRAAVDEAKGKTRQ